jgi:hypothetical protein
MKRKRKTLGSAPTEPKSPYETNDTCCVVDGKDTQTVPTVKTKWLKRYLWYLLCENAMAPGGPEPVTGWCILNAARQLDEGNEYAAWEVVQDTCAWLDRRKL